ncbi:hypothetical protein VS_2194 [Vibrio atlanticus]|uniref:Uncharacterized protein n=1 Tax=Vibrio atlanticus (strain LGP32) TaxID=575788 RepID=B7VHZ0_VIBA3|nr:hypothetical protein VS_2194 [Vibrio atlanticus]
MYPLSRMPAQTQNTSGELFKKDIYETEPFLCPSRTHEADPTLAFDALSLKREHFRT